MLLEDSFRRTAHAFSAPHTPVTDSPAAPVTLELGDFGDFHLNLSQAFFIGERAVTGTIENYVLEKGYLSPFSGRFQVMTSGRFRPVLRAPFQAASLRSVE